jgi:preprotein translocase subunit SecA
VTPDDEAQMKSVSLPTPGIVFGSYPERRQTEDSKQGRRTSVLPAFLRANPLKRFARDVNRAKQRREQLARLSQKELERSLLTLRAQMSREGMADDLVVEAFALISHFSHQALGMAPFDTQLVAAKIMLDNRLAEMATGEGKTLAAGVCAATAALAGIPVHVMTSNDYLVARDAAALEPLYSALGLSVDFVTQQMQADRRRQAYGADITYCTAKELAFDYLRDTIIRRGVRSDLQARISRVGTHSPHGRDTVMRGLCMAVVDEADSILIDEARVPLILARKPDATDRPEHHAHALRIAKILDENVDYCLNAAAMSASLTNAGREKVDRFAIESGAIGRNRLHRHEFVCQALAALRLYHRDRHYLVERGTVTIIDEMTGRVAPGRMWSRGLHQLIECKEGCQTTDQQITSAQITFQRFFQKYLCLGGMSGTLREARAELSNVYGLDVVKVPLRSPDRRQLLPTVIYPDRGTLARAVVSDVQRRQQKGQPVLIGTDSVAESEALSALLTENAITHTLLNARQDKAEAEIISKAGGVGSVTVATNMAGRGTDISPSLAAIERGGLHVISCQHNTSRRIDRQLIGRCGRQGDPGSAQKFLHLEQPLLQRMIPKWVHKIASREDGLSQPQWIVRLIAHVPQILEERRNRSQRRDMLKQDLKLERQLASIDKL